nr:MAG: O-antigen ligase domain-containing protein [Chloroflexota bacterium]
MAGLGLAGLAALAIALLPLTWATLLVVGAIVAVATLVQPMLGVLLLLPAVPFGSVQQVRLGVMNVGLAEILLGLAVAAWLLRQVVLRRIRRETPPQSLPRPLPWRWPPLALPLALFVGVALLSMASADSPQHSIKELIKWLEVLALYLIVSYEVRSVPGSRWARPLVAALLLGGALAALQGIYQFLFRVGPEAFILPGGSFMRAYGTFEQPNPYGGYLGLTLPVAAGLAVAWLLRVGGRLPSRWLGLALGCGGLMLAALIMSWSRGAWLGFAAALAAMAIAVAARSGRGAVLAMTLLAILAYVLLAGGVAALPPSIVARFADLAPQLGLGGLGDVRGAEITDANFAVLERMAHWQSALAMWTDHPWLGVGIGHYEPAHGRYALPLWPYPLGHAHNYYLNVAAETGLLGLLAYLLLWSLALLGAWCAVRRAKGWSFGLALGILGVLVHLSVHNFFDNLYIHAMYLQVAILLALPGGRFWETS